MQLNMNSMTLSFSKLTLFIHLGDLCLGLGIGGMNTQLGNLGQLSFLFHLDRRDRMFVKLVFSSLLYIT